jgi:hypothetical protein
MVTCLKILERHAGRLGVDATGVQPEQHAHPTVHPYRTSLRQRDEPGNDRAAAGTAERRPPFRSSGPLRMKPRSDGHRHDAPPRTSTAMPRPQPAHRRIGARPVGPHSA